MEYYDVWSLEEFEILYLMIDLYPNYTIFDLKINKLLINVIHYPYIETVLRIITVGSIQLNADGVNGTSWSDTDRPALKIKMQI